MRQLPVACVIAKVELSSKPLVSRPSSFRVPSERVRDGRPRLLGSRRALRLPAARFGCRTGCRARRRFRVFDRVRLLGKVQFDDLMQIALTDRRRLFGNLVDAFPTSVETVALGAPLRQTAQRARQGAAGRRQHAVHLGIERVPDDGIGCSPGNRTAGISGQDAARQRPKTAQAAVTARGRGRRDSSGAGKRREVGLEITRRRRRRADHNSDDFVVLQARRERGVRHPRQQQRKRDRRDDTKERTDHPGDIRV